MIKKILFILIVQSFLVGAIPVFSPRSYAIVCPDGTTLPDERADECPPAIDETTETASEEEPLEFATVEGEYQCGTGENAVKTGLNLGCKGAELEAQGKNMNSIVDMAFALFRVLSAGVGLIVIGSIIVAGIQYASSRGNPQATQAAISRVSSSVLALIMYMLIFALANYLVPGGMFI